ncbi:MULTISPECIES: hypothetical protein [Herbaspirillum]|uniref:Lipoprotein n=2 Tax=Herbaspirillum huttiense TaxID=863372 RepID=A0AAJ2HAJ6_9BURK|nr:MULTISPECIES: hypothetical protein [Herbaspirillum]MDR9836936.1 hypothetical protein [Herbaspirillum huttiense]
MRNIALGLLVTVVLTGCDVATEVAHKIADAYPVRTPTLAFEPGHKMMVGQFIASVSGVSECPSSGKTMRLLFGPSPDEGKFSCIVISPDTQEVLVDIGLRQTRSREVWKVERTGVGSQERVMLRRADGTYIANAE